jgi:hypothetical protein
MKDALFEASRALRTVPSSSSISLASHPNFSALAEASCARNFSHASLAAMPVMKVTREL